MDGQRIGLMVNRSEPAGSCNYFKKSLEAVSKLIIKDADNGCRQRLAPGAAHVHASVMHTKTISVSGTCLVPIDPSLLAQCPIGDEVDVSAENNALVIRPLRHQPRQGWAAALAGIPPESLEQDRKELAAFRETPHAWDSHEWEW